jgi:hypothetical protein
MAMATLTKATASEQRARLETLRAELGAAHREFARFLAQAFAAGQKPDDEECERLHVRIGWRERAVKVLEPIVHGLEVREASAAKYASEQQQRDDEQARKRREKDAASAALAWLDKLMSSAGVRGIRKRDALAKAQADGIDTAALQDALRALGVSEVDGAYVFGSRSTEAGVTYWRVGAANPRIARTATVAGRS